MNAKLAIALIWTTSAALVLKLVNAWDQLPERVAVHFGTDMQPNGWSSKNTLGAMVVLVAAGQAALATFVLLRVRGLPVVVTLVMVVVNVALVSAFWQTIRYNATGAPFQPLWMFLSLIAVFASIAAFMGRMMVNYYRR